MSAPFNLRGAVLDFHETYGHPVRDQPTLSIPDHELDLSFDLIAEEFAELANGVAAGDLLEVADALGDLLWVVESMAIRLGINTNRVLREIEISNASKLGANGEPVVLPNGKIGKGPNYRPPQIERALDPTTMYSEDMTPDPALDVIVAPSGGLANMYIPVEYPELAALRVVTPLSVASAVARPLRHAFVMRGILISKDWPEIEEMLKSSQQTQGGDIFELDC